MDGYLYADASTGLVTSIVSSNNSNTFLLPYVISDPSLIVYANLDEKNASAVTYSVTEDFSYEYYFTFDNKFHAKGSSYFDDNGLLFSSASDGSVKNLYYDSSLSGYYVVDSNVTNAVGTRAVSYTHLTLPTNREV